jgi:acyl-CoA-binding protein
MSVNDSDFESAAEAVKNLSEKPDNDSLLRLYALYKQATEGDVSGEKPGFFDFVGLAKFEAWEKIQGMESDAAKTEYVKLVKALGGDV